MNHVFVKGKVLGVSKKDIDKEIVIPFSRNLKEFDSADPSHKYIAKSIKLNSIPKEFKFDDANNISGKSNLSGSNILLESNIEINNKNLHVNYLIG